MKKKLERTVLALGFVTAVSSCSNEPSQNYQNKLPEECQPCDEILPEYCLRLICPEEYKLEKCLIFRGDAGSYYHPCDYVIKPCHPNGDAGYARCDGGAIFHIKDQN